MLDLGETLVRAPARARMPARAGARMVARKVARDARMLGRARGGGRGCPGPEVFEGDVALLLRVVELKRQVEKFRWVCLPLQEDKGGEGSNMKPAAARCAEKKQDSEYEERDF